VEFGSPRRSFWYLARLSGHADHVGACSQKTFHVAFEKKEIGQPAQRAKRRLIFETILHGGNALIMLKKVVVIKTMKGPRTIESLK